MFVYDFFSLAYNAVWCVKVDPRGFYNQQQPLFSTDINLLEFTLPQDKRGVLNGILLYTYKKKDEALLNIKPKKKIVPKLHLAEIEAK